MADAKNGYIRVSVADGTSMAAYVTRPGGAGPHPGILVFQEAYGVNAHIRDVADRFSREGYVALAPELFHRTAEGFEGDYTNFESTRVHTAALTNEQLERDIEAAFRWLSGDAGTDPARIASIGFCMGGRVSFLANSVVGLKAAVSFYGGWIAPANLSRAAHLRAPMLFFWGGLDKHIGPDQIHAVETALRAAGKPFVNVVISDADHGFFCDARRSFNRNAAEQAWALVTIFLNQHLTTA
jgi:carboxymethylenebutenolidase